MSQVACVLIQWNNCKCQVPDLHLGTASPFFSFCQEMLALAGNVIFSAKSKTCEKCYHLSRHTSLNNS